MLLAALGVEIRHGVRSLGPIGAELPVPDWAALLSMDDASPLRAVHRDLEPAMIALVDDAKARGETLGGSVTVIAHGVPVGLGSHVAWNEKLDGRIAQAMMSVPAVKAVEIGAAVSAAGGFGSAAHDAILYSEDRGFHRATNRAGGLEAGITNGEDVVVTLYKKPIATLRDGLPSVDLDRLEPHVSQYERSDVTALPRRRSHRRVDARSGVGGHRPRESGGDSMQELLAHFRASAELQSRWPRS